MAKRKHTTEQIIRKLREAEIELAKGQSIKLACKKLGVTEQTYYRWRKEYGGLRMDQARRFKQLEKENARLKKLLAEMAIDNAIVKEVAEGNFWARRVAARLQTRSSASWASRSGRRVGRWASRARASATVLGCGRMKQAWWVPSWPWRAGTGATVTAASRGSCGSWLGASTTSASSGSGVERG